MANVFKTFTDSDITTTRTLLHEAIPITGTIVSGTYNEENLKTFDAGTHVSQYDYPFLSSSANHIFDLTCGFSSSSPLSGAAVSQNAKKINIYNQLAQVLVGHDQNGNVLSFDRDGDLTGGTKHQEAFFMLFARLLTKDEVKKGSFEITFITGGMPTGSSQEQGGWLVADRLTIGDYGAAGDFRTNSPAGEYGILYTSSTSPGTAGNVGVGLLYYQAGVAVFTASIFNGGGLVNSGLRPVTTDENSNGGFGPPIYDDSIDTASVNAMLTGTTIANFANGVRNRIHNISFNNTTELNSSIYFCRANHNEFNYSSNPTYLDASKIRVKNVSSDESVAYITTVGLYSADNELLAVAKLSEPLKKTPSNEVTIRTRLDW